MCGTGLSHAQDVSRTDEGAATSLFESLAAPPELACTSGVISGTLGSGSPDWPSTSGTQLGRLNRNGIGSTCTDPKSCGIFTSVGDRAYDAYRFPNRTSSPRCVSVTLTVITQAACNLQANAYRNVYDPASICTGYLADPGLSSGSPPVPTSFSFVHQPGDEAIIVVHTTNPGEIGCQYEILFTPCTVTQGFYVLDAFGGLYAVGGDATPIAPGPPYFGFNVARDVEMAGAGAYVLDGFGGVHSAGGQAALTPPPPYFGFDIAQDLELAIAGGAYVLDGFGGVHAIGGAPVLAPATPYFGFNAGRDLELGGGGYYVLDAFGGLHVGAGATSLAPGPPYFGFDIAKDLELASGGGGYALDGFGGVHALGGAPALNPATAYFGFNIARDFELGFPGFYVLDGFGGLHRGGGAAAVIPGPPYFGFDAARDLEIH